jgi:uncharacterized sporulation protein YeaH/YhbH (DUF444 family)
MHHFIDRRRNPKGKSLGNRQLFIRRARAYIKAEVDRAVASRKVAGVGDGGTVSIPMGGIDEPRFRNASTGGQRRHVLSGNSSYVAGDRIPKPDASAGSGGGHEASAQGSGEDQFLFSLDREEFLNLLFDDLELPNLTKTALKDVSAVRPVRAGFRTVGVPANLNVLRTMRYSYSRRLALKRPSEADMEAVRARVRDLEGNDPSERLPELEEQRSRLAALERRRRWVPYIDPIDVRYSNFQPQPKPKANAVMFCLMDVSGSMGEREKDLAKRFFVLLHLFLQRRYERVDLVFVRHTHEAEEVDEETFFFSRETGGTVISSALVKMLEIVNDRYPVSDWNIYAAQASDGENLPYDAPKCCTLLDEEIMPKCQYYAYVEILDEREASIFKDPTNGAAQWRALRAVDERWQNFAMTRIASRGDIYPVFRQLFARHADAAAAA